MKSILRTLGICAVLIVSAKAQELQFASLGDFRVENGETIRDCRLGYRAFGRLDAAKSNAVLFPTWFTGTTKNLVELIGPGKLVDSTKYYVIAVDALGDGISSSPSNSLLQPHMKFPRFTIRDMVRSQHQLLTKELGIPHLRAVVGISMGGMQTFEWLVSFPDFMDRAVPIVGTPKLSAYDLLLWQAEMHAIEADENWKKGEYTERPAAAMRTVSDIHQLAVSTPQYRTRQTAPDQFSKFLADTEQSAITGFDTNDWYRQLQAMMAHDVSKPLDGNIERAAGQVHAKVLVIASLLDHMVNPQAALAFAKLLHAQTLELESDCGHLAFSCENARVVAAMSAFLGE